MDKEKKDILNDEIFALINLGKKEYKYFSSIDKFRYANKVMNLSRDYCCSLWNLDKQDVDTYFFSCDSFSGANFEREDGKHAFGVSLNSVLFGKPLDLFIISLHEMRHVFQDKFMNAEDNRTSLNYANGSFDNLGWYSSGAEIDADEFSYSTMLSFLKNGLEVQRGDITKLDYCKYKLKNAKDKVFHKAGEKMYSAFKLFLSNESDDCEFKYDSEEYNDEVKCLQIEDIESLAEEYFDIFNYYPKNRWDVIKNTKNISEDVKDIIIMDLQDVVTDSQQDIEQ